MQTLIVDARPPLVLRGGGKGGGGGGAKEASNTLYSKQIARFIEVISEGPIKGPVDQTSDLRSIYLNNTPVMNGEGQMNFQGIAIATRAGYPNQAPIGGFSAAETEVSVDVQVTVAEPIVRTITDSNNTSLRVTVELPALYAQSATTGDINVTPMHVQVWVQENGGIYNLIVDDDMGSQKTISPYDKAYRFPLPQPVVTRHDDGSVTTTGGAPWNVKVVRVTADSVTTNLQNVTIWKSYTEIIDGNFAYNDCALVAIAVDAQQFGTSIPTRRYEVFGRLVQVPTNYDPDTRQYNTDGHPWDGTFKVAYTNNPAWCYLDMVCHPRYGLGDRITTDQVDVGSLFTIAQWCDQLVDDGFGGHEPRYTFNAWIYERKEALKVLSDMVAVFRGIVFWGNGELMTRADMPATTRKLVSPANVIDGYFSYSGTALSARHTAALTAFSDPDDSYFQSIDVFEDLETIVALGYKPLETTAFGVTSRGQAHRWGRWSILTEKLQSDVVTYTASFDHLYGLGPYDIVRIADPAFAGQRMGGRIVYATANSVELDFPVALSPGATTTVDLQMPDDSIQTRQVNNASGEGIVTLTWDEALDEVDGASVLPNAGAMWMVATSDLEPRQFRILNMQEVDGKPNQVQVVALFHEPQKYAVIEQNVAFQPLTYARFTVDTVDPPADMNFLEGQYQVNGFWYPQLVVSWVLSDQPQVTQYRVAYTAPDGTVTTMADTPQNTVTLDQLQQGTYAFTVVAVIGPSGLQSRPLSGSYTVNGKTWPPSAPTDLTATTGFQQIVLKWLASGDADIKTYEVFAAATSIDATNSGNVPTIVAHKIGEAGASTTYTHTGLVQGQFFYYHVRAVDYAGNPSGMSNEAYGIASYLVPVLTFGKKAIDQSILVPELQEPIAAIPSLVDAIVQATGHGALALASVNVETIQRQTADSVLAEQITVVQATINGNVALVRQDLTAEVDARQAMASQVTDLQTLFNSNSAAINDSFTVLSNAQQSTATHVTTLSSTLGPNFSTVQTVSKALNGVTAEWTVKTQVDVNGVPYVAGMGLVTTINDKGTPTSEMTIIAEKFVIAHLLTDGTVAKGAPFYVGPDPTYTGTGTAPEIILLGGDGSIVYAGQITLNQLVAAGITTAQIVIRPPSDGSGGLQLYDSSGNIVLDPTHGIYPGAASAVESASGSVSLSGSLSSETVASGTAVFSGRIAFIVVNFTSTYSAADHGTNNGIDITLFVNGVDIYGTISLTGVSGAFIQSYKTAGTYTVEVKVALRDSADSTLVTCEVDIIDFKA